MGDVAQAKHMPDLEEGIEEEVDTPAVQAPAMAEDLRVHQVISSSLVHASTRPPPPSDPFLLAPVRFHMLMDDPASS